MGGDHAPSILRLCQDDRDRPYAQSTTRCVYVRILLIIGHTDVSIIGVVKTQWYSRWIKTSVLRADTKAGNKRELSMMHAFLDTVSTCDRCVHVYILIDD